MNDSKQYDPRGGAERARAARLDVGVEQIFPDRQSADAPRSRAASSKPLPQPQARPAAPNAPKALRAALGGARSDAARPDSNAVASGLDQSQGRADRRSRSGHASARRSPRIRRRCGCCRRSARRADISPRSAGPARASRRRTPTRSGPPSAPTLTPGQPVTLSWTQRRPASASRSDHLGRRRLSVHRQAARRQRSARRVVACGRSASSAAPTSRTDPRQLDQPRRPDRRVRRQGRLRRQLEDLDEDRRGASRSTASAAGSASPTNIG